MIARAGGDTERAYLRGAKLTRRAVQQLQQKRMDEALQKAERQLIQKQGELASTAASKEELESTKATLQALTKGVEQMRGLKAEGRIVIRLAPLEHFETSSYNLVLDGGETLEVPPRPDGVRVLGHVYNQTSFVHQPDMPDVADDLHKAGGPTAEADSSEMYLVQADGTVVSKRQFSVWNFSGFGSRDMLPGDTLVVPQKIERTAWLRDLKDITQILANVALSAGSVYLWFK